MSAIETQLQSTVNPALASGDISFATDWLQRGGVSLDERSATLREDPAEQSSLRRIFTLQPAHKFFRFTLGAVALHQPTNSAGRSTGPSDAFEVALLRADTGAPLRTIPGITRCDALLNLQANRLTHAAEGLHASANPDGSTTYTFELGNIPAGTDIVLCFDLLGFGDQDSHVTIRDVMMLESSNQVPVATDDEATTPEDRAIAIDVLANDVDSDGDELTVALVAGPRYGKVALNAGGTFTYTPDPNFFGMDSFTYRVSDGQLDSNVAQVNITVTPVNDPPVAVDDIASTEEDTQIHINVLANDRDEENSVLAASVVALPEHGELAQNPDGSFHYKPHADFFGTDSFTYRVSDGALDSNVARVEINVTPVNDLPVAVDATVSTVEDTPVRIDVLAGARDVDSSVLSPLVVTPPQHGELVQNADGSFHYKPHADFFGADSFTYRVNDGSLDSNVARVEIEVTPINDSLVAVDATVSTAEDTPVCIDVLTGARDVDSSELSASVVTPPEHGELVLNADGSFQYMPHADFFGADSFTYRVSDGSLESNIARVEIDVAPVNDPPVARDATASTAEDTPVRIDVLASARDVDSSALSASVVTPPEHGELVQEADGSFRYTPHADFFGIDSFTYRVSDGSLDSNIARVEIEVTPVNDAPTAKDSHVVTAEDTAIQINLGALVSDVDSAVFNTIITDPAHGTLQRHDDGTVVYRPEANYSGADSFTFQGNDGQLDSNVATVHLTITPVADAPTLNIGSGGSDDHGATRELFRTSWESVRNHSPTVTLVHERELEGWSLITSPDGSTADNNAFKFEIWSDGDRMHSLQGKPQTVPAAPGAGRNWLELNDSHGEGHQSIGIGRSVTTLAGANYTLSFEYAGHIGYDIDTTRIGIYLDGVKIASHAATSPATSLDWHTLQYEFSGNGQARSIRILTEATEITSNGRGAMIDNIALIEATPINSGFMDAPIHLATIHAALSDPDGSETLSVAIADLPAGFTLSDGSHTFTATVDNGRADVTGWNLAQLSLLPPPGFAGSLPLSVEATATERSNGATASTTATLVVVVFP